MLNNLVAIPPIFNLKVKCTIKDQTMHSEAIIMKNSDIDRNKYSSVTITVVDWNGLIEKEVGCRSVNQFKAALQRKI